MKNKFICLIMLFILIQKMNSQDIQFYFGKVDFDNATVRLINGKTLLGEVQDFNSPNAV